MFFISSKFLAFSVDPIAYASTTFSLSDDFPSTTIPSGDIRSLHFFFCAHFKIDRDNSLIKLGLINPNIENIEGILKQGKFEATIGNETAFKGGKDVTHVCRSADCSGIDSNYGCGMISQDQWVCRFRFSMSLSQEAAENQAKLTNNLDVITDVNGNIYLSEKLILYLDDQKVDELNIGEDLKGRATTDIQISGSGEGISNEDAMYNSLDNMRALQTILVTGSLPSKIQILKIEKKD